VATKYFAFSGKYGTSTFFLTITMNPHWPEYWALEQGKDRNGDSAMIAIPFKTKLAEMLKFI
jgi:hypothetical protein